MEGKRELILVEDRLERARIYIDSYVVNDEESLLKVTRITLRHDIATWKTKMKLKTRYTEINCQKT